MGTLLKNRNSKNRAYRTCPKPGFTKTGLIGPCPLIPVYKLFPSSSFIFGGILLKAIEK